jgi:hypothetical protein
MTKNYRVQIKEQRLLRLDLMQDLIFNQLQKFAMKGPGKEYEKLGHVVKVFHGAIFHSGTQELSYQHCSPGASHLQHGTK